MFASNSGTITPTPYRATHRPNAGRLLRAWLFAVTLAVVALLIGLASWFLFTAKRVEIIVSEYSGAAIERPVELAIRGGLSLPLGNLRLIRRGTYQIRITAPGYHDFEDDLSIKAGSRRFEYRLERLPAQLSVTSEPSGARIRLGETELGTTPLSDAPAAAGTWSLYAELPLYRSVEKEIEIEGLDLPQQLHIELDPDFARVSLSTIPSGAEVLVDREVRGITPLELDLASGTHTVLLRKSGYAPRSERLEVVANQAQELRDLRLTRASARLRVETTPEGAVVFLGDDYQGLSPLNLSLAPERTQRLRVRKIGYEDAERSLTPSPGSNETIRVELVRSLGAVVVQVSPGDAELFVDGSKTPQANTRLELSAEPHRLEFRRLGYEPVVREVLPRPGFTQRIEVRMLTLEDARIARLKPEITTAANHRLVLLQPTTIELGASRREAGRRANEVLREVPLTREFYLATTEVTNAEFRAFASGHQSGTHAGHSLDGDTQPVVNISWQDAARYCNWLSEQDGLTPVYTVRGANVEGWDMRRSGYRLPTEAEWAWAARYQGDAQPLLRMPWGDAAKPPERHGNYADTSATYVVSRVIFGYNDNHIVSAPVASFAANQHGLFDMGGNVAEWVQDFYEQSPTRQQPPDATGPDEGEYHVIRGSSWMHGSVSDLRLSYRDYGEDGRSDLGFRIARYVN